MACLSHLIVSLVLIAGTSICPISQAHYPILAATPTPAAAAPLVAALEAEREGRDSDAEAGYRSLLAAPDPAVRAEAQVALGRFLERRGRAANALPVLQSAVAQLGSTPDGRAARFLLGEAQSDLSDNPAATASFAAYLSEGGPARTYAAIDEAQALQTGGQNRDALAVLLLPLLSNSTTLKTAALQTASKSLTQMGEGIAGARDEQASAGTAVSEDERAAALLDAGRQYQTAGDRTDAVAVLMRLVHDYPDQPDAVTALDRLDALGSGVDPMLRGGVLLDLHHDSEAESTFHGLLASNPATDAAAAATYYLGVLADRNDDSETALNSYQSAFELDPAGPHAEDALWRRAELLRSLDRYADARAAYAVVVATFPNGTHAGDSAFNTGLMSMLAGDPTGASQSWIPLTVSSDKDEAARAGLWLGKLAEASGNGAQATAYLSHAHAAEPVRYFGLRAADAAATGDPQTASAVSSPPAADWSSVEPWLTSWAGPEPRGQFAGLESTSAWSEAMALDGLGWQETPAALVAEAEAGSSRNPWMLYRVARALQDRGLTPLALRAAETLLDQAPNASSPPADLLRLAYPLDYVELVNRAAGVDAIDPLLIEAVVRQESAFDPAAGSSAGAQGLTQLLPATAQDVAKSLGLGVPAAGDLARPAVNLPLGAAYLAQQRKSAAGDLSRTLAAYNAGAGNAARWATAADGDPDLFYESVDFGETRAYIRLVSQNYAMYQRLYRGLPR